MFGDGASIDSRSPCGSQFSFASETCASDRGGRRRARLQARVAARHLEQLAAASSSCAQADEAATASSHAGARGVKRAPTDGRFRPVTAHHYTGAGGARPVTVSHPGVDRGGWRRWYPLWHARFAIGRDREPRRTPRASRVETAQLVLPGLTNTHGTIFGGMLMQWIDIAGRHRGRPPRRRGRS